MEMMEPNNAKNHTGNFPFFLPPLLILLLFYLDSFVVD